MLSIMAKWENRGVKITYPGPVLQPMTAHWNGFDATRAVSHAIQEKKTAVTFRVSMGADSECEYSSIQSGRDPKLMITF